jgi:parvulin-like peptidyl-prolyl isomerase
LALGAAAGLAAAAWGLLQSTPVAVDGLPSDAIASVNGTTIRLEVYRRALAAVASDRRNPLDTEQKRHVLSRLIEEELLVQRGVELGLVRHDRRVRGDLVAAVIDSVVSSRAREASDAELEAFYSENADYFARPGRLRARALRVRAREGESEEAALERARRAAERVRGGEPIAGVDDELGDPQVAPLPDALLPPLKIREYLGPTALRHLLELEAGQVSEPLATPAGLWVLEVVEREPSRTPPFAELRAEVRAEWRRRAGDRALRSYLDELRDRGDVRVREPLP